MQSSKIGTPDLSRCQRYRGFTIVELLVVIVVVAILAAVTVVAYNGVSNRANNAKISSDLAQLQKAIMAARVNSGDVATRYVTGSTATASSCVAVATNVDMSDAVAAATCWTDYNNALNSISSAGSINVRGLKDPWGRPYFLDENEKEGVSTCGLGQDNIGAFPRPRTQSDWATTNSKPIPYVTPGC